MSITDASGNGEAVSVDFLGYAEARELLKTLAIATDDVQEAAASIIDAARNLAQPLDNIDYVAKAVAGVPFAFPINKNPNEISVSLPAVPPLEQAFGAKIVATNTGNVFITAGGYRQRLVNGGGQELPAGSLQAGAIAQIALAGGGAFVLISQETAAIGGDTDPLTPLRSYIVDNPYGSVVNNGGNITRSARPIRILGGGSSISVAQGGNAAVDAPNNILSNELNYRTAQEGIPYFSEIVGQPGSGTLDMPAQFASAQSQIPEKIRTYVPFMNDCYYYIFVMLHTFPVMRQTLKTMIQNDVKAGRIPVLWTSPHPHPDRVNLADARFDGNVANGIPMSYPVYKDRPTKADVINALGSEMVKKDWTGSGVETWGVRTMAHLNTMLRDLCRSIPQTILIDADWSFRRNGIEAAARNNSSAELDALYYQQDAVHFSSKGYQIGFGAPTKLAAQAMTEGDVRIRQFRA